MNRTMHCFGSLCWLALAPPVWAGDDPANFKPLAQVLGEPESAVIQTREKEIKAALLDPDVLNTLLGELNNSLFRGRQSSNTLRGALKDLTVQFKAFDAKNAGENVGLGLEYHYHKSVVGQEISASPARPVSLSFNLNADGNVAFDQDQNPDDFLESGGSLHLFGSRGGFEPIVDETAWNVWAATQQARILELAEIETEEELENSPLWRAFEADVKSRLSTQFFWDLAGNFALESNQDFSQKQLAYGLRAGGVIRAWNEDSPWATFNFFDWPFTVLRYLTGADRPSGFRPSGQAIPLVLAGIDLVDPLDNDTRLAVDPDEGTYPRFRFEAAFKTKVARLLDRDVWFDASYRYYQELDASRAVRAAELDASHYFAASLEFLGGVMFTYSTGKLPLDGRTDDVFALGYRVRF